MHFLRTLFWVMIAVVGVIFAMRNWTTATVSLWGGLQLDVKLPLLLLGAFLIGLLPPLILLRATRWRLRRRLDSAERALADARAIETPAEPSIDRLGMPLPLPPSPPGALL